MLALLACGTSDPLDQVKALHREGRFAASLEPLRALLAERGEDPEVQYRYGLALRRSGEPGLAIWSLRRASKAPDWQVVAGLELAAAAVENNSYPAAIEAASRVLEVEPDNFEALHLRGVALLYDKSDPEAALADFEHMLEIDPEDFPAKAQRVAALLRLERVEEAQQALDAFGEGEAEILLDPRTRAHLCVAGASFARERGALREAEQGFEACLEKFPTQWIVVTEAVQFFDELRMVSRSNAILGTALEAQPEAAAFRSALAERLVASGGMAEAEALLRAGTQLENQTAATQAWGALANHFLARSEFTAAADAYEHALEHHPEPAQQDLLNLADLLALAGQHERAIALADGFEDALFRDLIHARVHLEKRQPREALERLDAALRLWPDNASARYFAARASEQIGDFDRAIEEYRHSIRAGVDRTDAALRLARLHAAEGARRPAVLAAGHYLRAHPGDLPSLSLALRASEQLGDRKQIAAWLVAAQTSGLWAQAQAIRAEAIAARQGALAAVQMLRADPRLDFTRPRDAPALRALVIQLDAAGRGEEAAPLVAAALAAHPKAAEFLAVRGLLLEREHAPEAEVRSAYERALARDAVNLTALLGMARLESRAAALDAALSFYDRAARADPSDPLPARMAASLLADAGHSERAEQRFEELLREHPYAGEAALALARLRIARGAASDRTLLLARQAERFGAAEEARTLIATLESPQNPQ